MANNPDKNKRQEEKFAPDEKTSGETCSCSSGEGASCLCEGREEDICEGELGGGELGIWKKKAENLESLLKEKDEELLRKAADLDNYRKRLLKETEDKIRYANQSVVADFLRVLDNIELTLTHAEDNSPLKEGVELTIKSFKDTLNKYGVTEIDSAPGTKFDPAVHEALMMDSRDDFDDNAVTLSVQKGYRLGDRIIRPAKVKVNKR